MVPPRLRASGRQVVSSQPEAPKAFALPLGPGAPETISRVQSCGWASDLRPHICMTGLGSVYASWAPAGQCTEDVGYLQRRDDLGPVTCLGVSDRCPDSDSPAIRLFPCPVSSFSYSWQRPCASSRQAEPPVPGVQTEAATVCRWRIDVDSIRATLSAV